MLRMLDIRSLRYDAIVHAGKEGKKTITALVEIIMGLYKRCYGFEGKEDE
jgi:hypothetical protein